MQLKMATRRSLNGSMTVVGDIAQATGPHAPDSWDEVVRHLPDRKPPRVIGLSVGYRIPEQIMDLANRVMHVATPGLRAPRAVRVGEAPPSFFRSTTAMRSRPLPRRPRRCSARSAATWRWSSPIRSSTPCRRRSPVWASPTRARRRGGLDDAVTVVPVSVAKGLELDGVVVVEPADIVSDSVTGLRALYVALTRSTQRLTVVHAKALPEPLQPQPTAA